MALLIAFEFIREPILGHMYDDDFLEKNNQYVEEIFTDEDVFHFVKDWVGERRNGEIIKLTDNNYKQLRELTDKELKGLENYYKAKEAEKKPVAPNAFVRKSVPVAATKTDYDEVKRFSDFLDKVPSMEDDGWLLEMRCSWNNR